jgi:hypothetical protein
MNKVTEDLIAQELSESIEILWDNRRILFNEQVDIEDMSYIVQGTIDCFCRYNEDTNVLYMTYVDVYISDIKAYNEDGETDCRVNKTFVEKYLQQYISSL